MRIVHIADTHLGLSGFNRVDPETGMNLREKLVYDNFLESIDVIIGERPDVLVHAGDLFDRVKPKTRAYTVVLDALDRLDGAGIPLVIVAGNHSMPKTRYTPSPFEVLSYHPSGINAAYGFRYEHVEIGDAVFHLIPNLLSPGHYREEYDRIEPDRSSLNILVTHGLASTISDRRLKTVAEHELDSTILSSDFDYIALGHFHDQVQVTDNAWYSGSIEYCTYNEIRDTKGGLVFDSCTSEVSHLSLPNTPMIDLGIVQCSGLSVPEITERVNGKLDRTPYPDGRGPTLLMLTLREISTEDLRAVNPRSCMKGRDNILDLKVKAETSDEFRPLSPERDLRSMDFAEEFESFIEKKQLSKRESAFVSAKGAEVLKKAVSTHGGGTAE